MDSTYLEIQIQAKSTFKYGKSHDKKYDDEMEMDQSPLLKK